MASLCCSSSAFSNILFTAFWIGTSSRGKSWFPLSRQPPLSFVDQRHHSPSPFPKFFSPRSPSIFSSSAATILAFLLCFEQQIFFFFFALAAAKRFPLQSELPCPNFLISNLLQKRCPRETCAPSLSDNFSFPFREPFFRLKRLLIPPPPLRCPRPLVFYSAGPPASRTSLENKPFHHPLSTASSLQPGFLCLPPPPPLLTADLFPHTPLWLLSSPLITDSEYSLGAIKYTGPPPFANAVDFTGLLEFCLGPFLLWPCRRLFPGCRGQPSLVRVSRS